MPSFFDGNWIQTEALSSDRTSWAVVRDGKVLHSDELEGDDASGWRAYETALQWAAVHCPGVAFHWRHRALIHRP